MSAVDNETGDVTFTADKTPQEMRETVGIPTWCVITFAPDIIAEDEASFDIPPAWVGGDFAFGYIYDQKNARNAYVVVGASEVSWKLDLTLFGS